MASITLENSILDRLAVNPEALQAFPFLRQLTAAANKGGCSSCGKPSISDAARNNVKIMIASLVGEPLAAFKRLLNADEIRVFYVDGVGRLQNQTI